MSFATPDFDIFLEEVLELVDTYAEKDIKIDSTPIGTKTDVDDFFGYLKKELKNNGSIQRLKNLETGKVTLTFEGEDRGTGRWQLNFFLEAFRRVDSRDVVIWTITADEALE